MSFPSSALGVLTEMQLTTGEWVDITGYVYGNPGSQQITIGRGRSSESFGIEPAHSEFWLDNQDGRFSPRNPRGAYYGLFSRNSPIRHCVKPGLTTGTLADLADTFNRTVALGNSWGTSDTGQTWTRTTATLASKLSVSSGTGRHLLSSATDTPGSLLQGVVWTDVDAYYTFTLPVATGNSLFTILSTRTMESIDANRGMRLRCEVTTAGAVKLQILAGSTAAQITNVTVSGLTHTGQALRMRTRLAGTTLMGKVWDASGAEPAAWQTIATDTNLVSWTPGTIVITTNASTGNTNTPFTAQYDNVAVTDIEPRFYGELTKLPVKWTEGAPSNGAVWVQVDAGGIFRRMSSAREKKKSSLWRYLEANPTGLQAYYPMADGTNAGAPPIYFQYPILGTLADGRSSGPGAAVFYNTPGTGALADWLEPGVQLAGPLNEFISLDRVNVPANAGAGWSIDWVRQGAQPATIPEHLNITTANSDPITVPWSVTLDAASSSTNIILTDANLASHSTSVTSTGLYDGAPHHLRLRVTKSGTNLVYNLAIDGSTVLSSTIAAPDDNGASSIATAGWDHLDTTPASIGHVMIWDTNAPSVANTATAALGHPSEDAVARIIRICGEEGLAYFTVDVDGTGGEDLGQQPIGTPYDVIAAAAAADQGFLSELRDAAGVLYQTRDSAYSQSTYTYTYTTDGHLTGIPEPTDDDAQLVNSTTITRQFAGPQVYEQTSGTLGTANPPSGVGRYDSSATLNLASDLRTLHAAQWRVALGTVDKARWPVIHLSIGHMLTHSQTTQATNTIKADAGYKITLSGLPSFLPPGDVNLIVLGSSETLDQFRWLVDLNCAPYDPYNAGVWSGGSSYKWDASYSTLAAGATSSATSLSVATSQGSLWTTSAGDFPFDVNIGGVRITVTNITGASSPQTFTVTRSVDGFDLALSAGAAVNLWTPSKWGL